MAGRAPRGGLGCPGLLPGGRWDLPGRGGGGRVPGLGGDVRPSLKGPGGAGPGRPCGSGDTMGRWEPRPRAVRSRPNLEAAARFALYGGMRELRCAVPGLGCWAAFDGSREKGLPPAP